MGGSNPTECRNNRSQPQPAGTLADSPNEGPSLKHPQQQSEGSSYRDPGTHSYQHNPSARDEKASSRNQPKVAPVVQQQFLDIGSPAPAADEIKVALNSVHEGQSFKFSIPGTSQSVTLNFSADALAKMRNCVSLSQEGGVASRYGLLLNVDLSHHKNALIFLGRKINNKACRLLQTSIALLDQERQKMSLSSI